MNRRNFFKGLAASSFVAPAIIKYELLMPVKSLIIPKINFEAWNHIIVHNGKLFFNGNEISLIKNTIESTAKLLLDTCKTQTEYVKSHMEREIISAYNSNFKQLTITKTTTAKAESTEILPKTISPNVLCLEDITLPMQ